jgi:hypothetical protein
VRAQVAPRSGGQLLGKGVDVENYPGVTGTDATGPAVVQLMRRQAASFDTRMLDDVLVVSAGCRMYLPPTGSECRVGVGVLLSDPLTV